MGDESFGSILRRMRLEREWSLRQLSMAAHIDFTYLSKVENGLREPTDTLANSVDIALAADGVLIAMAQVQRVASGQRAVPLDTVRRRAFIASGAATAVASLGGTKDVTKRVGRVGVSDVHRLERAVDRLRTLGHQHGGANLWEAATGVASEGFYLLEQGQYTEEVEQLLLGVTSRAQMCAGWLAFDTGRQDAARSSYNEALSLARQTANASVEIHALANLAHQSLFLGMPRQALRYAEAARRVALTFSPNSKMSVVPFIREATAYALEGNRSASAKAITAARTKLDAAKGDDEDSWVNFVSPGELNNIEAATKMRLGDNRQAEALWVRAIGQHSTGYLRNRAISWIRLGVTRLDLNEVEGAALAADEALNDLSGEVESYVATTELNGLAARLAPHAPIPEVGAFMTRYLTQA